MAAEISFNDISSFCKFIDEQKKRKQKGFTPIILMSLDVERALLIKAWSQFYENDFGQKTFRGIPFKYIIADGYLSFAWEAEE